MESSSQCGVSFEVLLVFRPCCGGDGTQFTTSQRRFQNVGGVSLTGLAAGTDHRVGFIDEQDNGTRRTLDLLDHRLEPILEFPFDARTSLQQRQVQGANHDIPQRWRDVASRNAQRKALGHSRLAHSGFAREDGIVLTAPHEDVDDLSDLGISAQNGIDLASPRPRRQVHGVLVQGGRRGGTGRRGGSRRR